MLRCPASVSNYFCEWHCVLVMAETVHPLHRSLCHAAAKLARTCSATCRQWQRLL